MRYDVIVIGAGHAGCEAASAAANMGSKTLLITMDMNKIAQMSCNPAVGGIAKGQIVREIDALGGNMGIITDQSSIQFRMLNRSKGPAMWSPRSQCDRTKFIDNWRKMLDSIEGLNIWQDTVTKLLVDDGVVRGVECGLGVTFESQCVILTAGTFLNGLMHVGRNNIEGGRISESSSYGLTEQLVELGFTYNRMKTGTPMRIDGRTIDFSKMQRQDGDVDEGYRFSYIEGTNRLLSQRPCWITFTNEMTHQILRDSLDESPMYNGQIQSIGPRYCPSIETKIVTFADKTQHQLFIEPEGESSAEYYINGFSSSLPMDVQFRAIRTVEGLENVVAYRPGYAIEYDYFEPTQLKHTLETKLIKNLFFAGQVNGTTGYEEAAGQGLIAGINAHQKCVGGEDFILHRDESYIGVLIDDLVNKGVDEPYRMFTSRAEYRILLRQDDADMRLTEKGYNVGLVSQKRYDTFLKKKKFIELLKDFLKNTSVDYKAVNVYLESVGSSLLSHNVKIETLLTRPNVTLLGLMDYDSHLKEFVDNLNIDAWLYRHVLEEVEINVKYAGYIEREKIIAEKIRRLDYIKIPDSFSFDKLQSLSTEARQKLEKLRPRTIGDASRIPGVSPNDINVLLLLLGR